MHLQQDQNKGSQPLKKEKKDSKFLKTIVKSLL